MKVMFIHGRAQEGQDPAFLLKQWQDAIATASQSAGLQWPADVEVVFPFFGDELDRMVRELDAPLPADIVARGAAIDSDELQFRAQMFTEMAKGCAISDADIQSNFDSEPREKGPLNWKWVHALLKTLGQRSRLGDRTIDRFTRDVYVYMTYPPVRKLIDKIVQDKLTQGKWVVVGHSLGSVIGYNVLSAIDAQKGVEVTRYVTVGSPLAIRPIHDRLDTPLRMPPCVKSWYNAYDPRDVVALYPLDSHNFKIEPPITNKGTVDNFTDNRHGIAGYLNDRDVVHKILEALHV